MNEIDKVVIDSNVNKPITENIKAKNLFTQKKINKDNKKGKKSKRQTFVFINDSIKEKDVERDFIEKPNIKQNSELNNFNDNVNPEEVCNGRNRNFIKTLSELDLKNI